MKAMLYDDRACHLGEGPFWHPERNQLFWFDILGRRLLSRVGEERLAWEFERIVSAAGWIDTDRLLVAGAGALMIFDLCTGKIESLGPLEAERPDLRSNDGRADPFGGFWIGVMGRKAELEAGGIWRYYKGDLRRLYDGITIPNAISFTADGRFAHFADTRRKTVWRVALGSDGRPIGEPRQFLDFAGLGLNPDGAVCDADNNLWIARWGAGAVSCHDRDGREVAVVEVPAAQTTCPAFGGPDLSTLYVTSAREDLDAEALRRDPLAGFLFSCPLATRGQREHRVIL